jgi:hypothetical protein
LKKNETGQETEFSTETAPEAVGTSAQHTPAPNKKPFVEPVVKQPVNLLDVTAFFQGSAALDIAGGL